MRILVTRAEEDAGPFADALVKKGHEPVLEPLISIHYESEITLSTSGVQAILLTSANGARALASAVRARDIPILAVGDATARMAEDRGFEVIESAGGDASALAELVRRTLDPDKGRLLHVAGSHVAGDLVGDLTAAGFDIDRRVLYRAAPAGALSGAVRTMLGESRLDAVTLFSPRTADIFLRLTQDAGLTAALGCVTCFALSAAVAGRAGRVAWGKIKTAPEPNQRSLLELIPG